MALNKDGTLWGIKIWDNTGIYYYTEVEVSQDLEHNVPVEVTVGYNKKFPFVTHNGIAFYYSGSCSGKFADNTDECLDDYNFEYTERENGDVIYNVKYMNGFVKWLNNKRTKYIQLSEQLVIPCNISSPIKWSTETTIDDGYNCTISFDWVQADEDFALDEVEVVTTCPRCKRQVSPFAYFCQNCGYQISTAKDRVHTGCFNDDGEITFLGTLYDNVDLLNAELSKYNTDITNREYADRGFKNSIAVFNASKGFVSVISCCAYAQSGTSHYRKIWVDNAVAQTTTSNGLSVGSNIGQSTVQWGEFTENSGITDVRLGIKTVVDHTQALASTINLNGTSSGNKYVIIDDYWKPYSLRTSVSMLSLFDDETESEVSDDELYTE